MEKLEKEKYLKEKAIEIISANVGSAFDKTKSLEVKKYAVLIRQIARKRLECKRLTRVDWLKKEIKPKPTHILTREQEEVLLWILENEYFLTKEIERLLRKFKLKV